MQVLQRCPRCGNENPADSYACSFCGIRLKIEKIETVSFFRRYEAEWTNPYPWYLKIFYLFIQPNRAFWDINHKRSKAPGWLILIFCSLLYGLMGLTLFSHFNFVTLDAFSPLKALFTLSFFGAFFIFGFFFQLIYFSLLIWLVTKGANYAVGFTERLEGRFGKIGEVRERYKEEEISPFSIYKGGTMLHLEASYKFRMLLCAFTPLLLINAIKILIVLVAFPTVDVPSISIFNEVIFDEMFRSKGWAALDIIDALTIAIWVPILMTLAIRELSNSSTFRVLIPTLIIGILVAVIFYFLRPTIIG
jgi:hypothetical protein